MKRAHADHADIAAERVSPSAGDNSGGRAACPARALLAQQNSLTSYAYALAAGATMTALCCSVAVVHVGPFHGVSIFTARGRSWHWSAAARSTGSMRIRCQ